MQIFNGMKKLGNCSFAVIIGAALAAGIGACERDTDGSNEKRAAPNYRIEDPAFNESESEHDRYLEASGAYDEVLLGREVEPGAFLDVVLIGAPDLAPAAANSGASLCSGVLVAKGVVATAAHCLGDPVSVGSAVIFGPFAPSLEAEGGAGEFIATTAIEVSLPPIAMQGQINSGSGVEDVFRVPDVALIRLDRMPEGAVAAPLAAQGDVAAARFARVVGFGLTEQQETGRKNQGDVVVASSKCLGAAGEAGMEASDHFSCWSGRELVAGRNSAANRKCSIEQAQADCRTWNAARDRATQAKDCSIDSLLAENRDRALHDCADTCYGDSGGPLYVVAETEAASAQTYFDAMDAAEAPPRYMLAGLTSRAVDNDNIRAYTSLTGKKCGNGGIYTLIAGDVALWINKQIDCWAQDGDLSFDDTASADTEFETRFSCTARGEAPPAQ